MEINTQTSPSTLSCTYRVILVLTIFASFGLQASAPFMPDKTAIEISDIPSERQSDYQFNVVTISTSDIE